MAHEARAAAEMALGTALWLVPCGLVEGFVTPRGLSIGEAWTVGLTLALFFWALVWWRGRAPEPAPGSTGAGQRVTSELGP